MGNPAWHHGMQDSRPADKDDSANGVAANSELTACVWRNQNNKETQHIFYRNANDAIQEFWFVSDALSWKYHIVTPANAPKATGSPFACAGSKGKTQHVFYRGVDKNVHELRFAKSGENRYGWWHHCLTETANVIGDPQAVLDMSDSIHLFYNTEGPDNNEVCQSTLVISGENPTWSAPRKVIETNQTEFKCLFSQSPRDLLWYENGVFIELRPDGRGEWLQHKMGHALAGEACVEPQGMPMACATSDGQTHLVYRNGNALYHLKRFAPGEAKLKRLNIVPAGVTPGDPKMVSWPGREEMYLVYRGEKNGTHQLYGSSSVAGDFGESEAIVDAEVEPESGGHVSPVVDVCGQFNPVIYTWTHSPKRNKTYNTLHVVYVQRNGQIRELWADSDHEHKH
jgi:hypothetical protein